MKRHVTHLIAVLLLSLNLARAADEAPRFELGRFDDGSKLSLDHWAGKIVVLDFFAHWCGPCARSTPVVEAEIQKYYEKRNGNPQGVPVQVVSINVEADDRKATAAFIRKHGPSLVLNDVNGATLAAYRGGSLPYFVILDGTPSRSGEPARFRIAYARAGFEGAGKLRAIIDRLGVTKP